MSKSFIEHLWTGRRSPAKAYIFAILAILLTITETARVAFMPDAPAPRSDFLRGIVLLFAIFDFARLTIGTVQHGFQGFSWNHAWDLFALIAECAKTIDTIPPRQTREPAARRSEAHFS